MPLVELQSVSKRYGTGATSACALEDATFAIGEQEFVALMGRSGSGKSTILSIIGAITPPTTGRVTVDDIEIHGLSVERRADFRREYLGFVFQQLFLVPYLTALQNVMLPLAASRVASRRQREMASEALTRVGLADKAPRLPRDLSGGEQQRVAIARAIVNAPPLLLADEPTGCLDSRTGAEVIDVLHALRGDGLTIFLVTHDSAVAARADRTIHVEDGRVSAAIANGESERLPCRA